LKLEGGDGERMEEEKEDDLLSTPPEVPSNFSAVFAPMTDGNTGVEFAVYDCLVLYFEN